MSSYREFLSNLIIERNEYFKIHDELNNTASEYFTSYVNIQNTLSRIYAKSILNTNLILNKNIVIRVCNRLMNAKTIDIYGVGISHACAVQFTFKLQSIAFNCRCHSGINKQYLQNLINTNDNVSILITTTGCNKTILDISNILNKKISITQQLSKIQKEKSIIPVKMFYYTILTYTKILILSPLCLVLNIL